MQAAKCSALHRWCAQHKPRPLLREETVPAVRCAGQPRSQVCTSLAPRPMTVVFGLGTRLRVRMRTTFENGVLRNGQQPGSAVNSFIESTWVNLEL